MKRLPLLTWRDFAFVLIASLFFLGCVASSYRSGKTLRQGQVSVGGSYTGVQDLEESESDMIQLIAVDGRVGVVDGLDLGFMHTWDATGDNEGLFSTFWGDIKWQVTNREGDVGEPILSLGLLKGYVYNKDADVHITSFPVILSVPASDSVTPFFVYRWEQISDDFIPEALEGPRHGFFIGSEFELGEGNSNGWTPQMGVSVGALNSLGGGEGNWELVLSGGVCFDSPK